MNEETQYDYEPDSVADALKWVAYKAEELNADMPEDEEAENA